MQCPVDGTTLETHTVHSVSVEECPKCHGLWFEGGELRQAKDAEEPGANWLDFDLWSKHGEFSADWSSHKCPRCGKSMASLAYSSTGVTVDYCVDRHGVWLHKGEFEAILAALHEEALSKTLPEYVAASLQQARELITGQEGFISEWKDLATVTRLLEYRFLVENPKLAELLFALQATSPLR